MDQKSVTLSKARQRAISQRLMAVTGVHNKIKRSEVDGPRALVVWSTDILIEYVLSLNPCGFRRSRVLLGVRRGLEQVETRYDGVLEWGRVARILDQPGQIVGVWVGQRSTLY